MAEVAATLPRGIVPQREGAGPRHAGTVNASEFAFLAIGLILGVASGAALVEVLRARPPAPREVRLTISPDAIPRRRGSTLAHDAFAAAEPEPARGGPADHRIEHPGRGWHISIPRTPVRSPDSTRGSVLVPSYRMTGGVPAGMVGATPATMVGFRVEPGRDPMFQALQRGSEGDPAPLVAVGAAVAVLEAEMDDVARTEDMARAQAAGPTGSAGVIEPLAPIDLDGPCAGVRQVATERCDLAVRGRAGAGVADETLRAAQRAYDIHVAKAETAAALTDPATVRRDKEAAQAAFRDARNRAGSPDAVEGAARDWLGEINRINTVVRDAAVVVAREREAAAAIAPALERLALEADAARIKAEAAEAACVAARQAVAECVEAQVASEHAARVAVPPGSAEPGPAAPSALASGPAVLEPEGEPLAAALGAGQAPVIFRLLRGDALAMTRTAARLAEDPAERRRWQASLSELVDAIVAVSISQSALDFPTEHLFWGPFTKEQDRDIVAALSSLGFRFDGLGGWVDERVPSQRDLSMAMGYAGLDPMRIRQWPNEAEMQNLFAEVTVAADEHLAGAAGDLTLGELVAMLGRRADGLAMLWNDWGRVRPLLLEDA